MFSLNNIAQGWPHWISGRLLEWVAAVFTAVIRRSHSQFYGFYLPPHHLYPEIFTPPFTVPLIFAHLLCKRLHKGLMGPLCIYREIPDKCILNVTPVWNDLRYGWKITTGEFQVFSDSQQLMDSIKHTRRHSTLKVPGTCFSSIFYCTHSSIFSGTVKVS